jgi:hypothetical protein
VFYTFLKPRKYFADHTIPGKLWCVGKIICYSPFNSVLPHNSGRME